jgi:putative spermidine/putrescine transport system permease protein
LNRDRSLFVLQLAFTLGVCVFLIAPMGVSVLVGLTADYLVGLKSGLTLRWVGEVWQGYRGTIFLSIGIALACLSITLLLGVPAAYALARARNRWSRAFEELLMLPVAVPGLATALALIATYGGWRDLRTSWVFILIGHVLFTLPFMMRSVLAVLSAIDLKTLEEGTASLGAGFHHRFFDIVLPNCRNGILTGSLMVLTLSVGEFNMTWLLHTPLTKTLPVGLADAYASLRLEIGSAYTLIFFLLIVPLLVALQALARPARRHRAGARGTSGGTIRETGARVRP